VLPQDIFVNQFEQQCFQYFVERTKFDTRFDIEGYSGHADAYLSAKTLPSGPDTDTVDLRVAHGANRAVSLSVAARTFFGQPAGAYYLCFYAYTPFSAKIMVKEKELGEYTEAKDNQVLTHYTLGQSYFVARYKNSAFTSDGVLTIWMEGQNLNENSEMPKLWYRVCDHEDEDECNIENKNMGDGYLCELDADGVCGGASVHVTPGAGVVA